MTNSSKSSDDEESLVMDEEEDDPIFRSKVKFVDLVSRSFFSPCVLL